MLYWVRVQPSRRIPTPEPTIEEGRQQNAPLKLTIAAGLVCALLATVASAQVIQLDPEYIDLGTMKQNESRDIQVTVTNNGGGQLQIDNVEADCGCTVPTLKKSVLLPGESTIIDINFNSKKFTGNVRKHVTITSNDPGNPEVVFAIEAKVNTALKVNPPQRRLNFDKAPMGTIQTQSVIFSATEAPQLEIRAEGTRHGLFEVEVENSYQGDPRTAALHVTVPATMPPGSQRDNVRVRTNLPDEEYVDIQLSAFPLQLLQTNISQINFRFRKNLDKVIRVTPGQNDLKFKITEVTCDLPEIKIQMEETVPNEQTTIWLSGEAIDKADPRAVSTRGRIKGELTIHTDLPDLPRLVLPITYMVRM